MTLSEHQIIRYSRHILLPDVGGVGQARLLEASIEVAVGRDTPAAIAALAYLAAAGVGRLVVGGDPDGAVTSDEVRTGILFGAADAGRRRVEALRDRIRALNPDVTVEAARGAPAGPRRLAVIEAPAPNGADAMADALVAGGGAAAALLADIAGGGA